MFILSTISIQHITKHNILNKYNILLYTFIVIYSTKYIITFLINSYGYPKTGPLVSPKAKTINRVVEWFVLEWIGLIILVQTL